MHARVAMESSEAKIAVLMNNSYVMHICLNSPKWVDKFDMTLVVIPHTSQKDHKNFRSFGNL